MRFKFAGQWRVTGWQAAFETCSEGFGTPIEAHPGVQYFPMRLHN